MSLLLLPEWQRYRENWNKSTTRCIVFGSFLNLESLELAHKLTQACIYNTQSLPEKICWDSQQILLIFFPISRKLQENFEMKDRVEDIVQERIPDSELQSMFQTILTRAHEIVERNKRNYLLRNQWQYPVAKRNDLDEENRFVFGPLAAKYLKEMVYFPKIIIGEQTYNGIPLNYSVTDFFDKLLQPQLEIDNIS